MQPLGLLIVLELTDRLTLEIFSKCILPPPREPLSSKEQITTFCLVIKVPTKCNPWFVQCSWEMYQASTRRPQNGTKNVLKENGLHVLT